MSNALWFLFGLAIMAFVFLMAVAETTKYTLECEKIGGAYINGQCVFNPHEVFE